MIPKVTYGDRVRGLLEYLWGPGKSDEHTNPRIVAGYDVPESLAPELFDDEWGLADLAAKLNAPQLAAGDRGMGQYVWQCSLSLPPYEGGLDDEKWGQIAERFVEKMGFAQDDEHAGCRWIAVHHGRSSGGNDHIHVVVTLATEDGVPVWLEKDKKHSQTVCRELEDEFGLGKWVRRDDDVVPLLETTRAEVERSRREDRGPDREVLRRHVRAAAAGANSEAEWIERLTAAGVMVNPYEDKKNPGRVVGYGVAMGNRPKSEQVWFNAKTLDEAVGLRRLRERWPDTTPLSFAEFKDASTRQARTTRALADAERMALWRSSATALSAVTARMGEVAPGSPEWPAIARASADVLARVALTSEPSGQGPMSRAADALARAAAPRRRDPAAAVSRISADLGRVSDALMVAGSAREARDAALMMAVVIASARLVTLLAEMLRAQQELQAAAAAQAAAAQLVPIVAQARDSGVLAQATTLEPAAGTTPGVAPTVPPTQQPVRPAPVHRPQPDRRDERDHGR